MKVKSTLRVISEADCEGRRGVTDGQTYQRLVGWPEVHETDRVRLGRATCKPGAHEQLHWHPIEACYYVITVDKKTKRSYIDLEDLAYREAISFKSHY